MKYGPPEFRQIKDFPNYWISAWGEIWTKPRPKSKSRILRASEVDGYCRVQLFNKDGRTGKLTHRLVAKAFLPNPQMLPVVHHINHNKSDNRVENLQWVSNRENLFYSGITQAKNETQALVLRNTARELYKHDLPLNHIGMMLNVSDVTVAGWIKGLKLRPKGPSKLKSGLNSMAVYDLYHTQAFYPKELAKMLNMTTGHLIRLIKAQNKWRDDYA